MSGGGSRAKPPLVEEGDAPEDLTWSSSFTRSIGATAVLEMAAAIPPAKKSLANEMAVSLMARRY